MKSMMDKLIIAGTLTPKYLDQLHREGLVSIECTNITKWMENSGVYRDGVSIAEFPCIKAPHKWVWLEYAGFSRENTVENAGMLVSTKKLPEPLKFSDYRKSKYYSTVIQQIKNDSSYVDIMDVFDWNPEMPMLQDIVVTHVQTSVHSLYLKNNGFAGNLVIWDCLDEYGHYSIPLRRYFVPPALLESMKDAEVLKVWSRDEDEHPMFSYIHELAGIYIPMYFALNAMHVKSVTLEEIVVDEPVRRKRERKYGYKGLVLKRIQLGSLFKHKTSDAVQSDETVVARHMCRGHFRTYTAERPMLGKHVGTFWVEMHARGSTKRGQIVKDYGFAEDSALLTPSDTLNDGAVKPLT